MVGRSSTIVSVATGGLLAFLFLVATTWWGARRPDNERSAAIVRGQLVGLIPVCMGLFVSMLLPFDARANDSVVQLVVHDGQSAAMRATLALLVAVPLLAAAMLMMTVRSAQSPHRLAAVSMVLAVLLCGLVGLEIALPSMTVKLHPIHMGTWLGLPLSLIVVVMAGFRHGWGRLSYGVAAVLLAPLPILGQMVSLSLDWPNLGPAVPTFAGLLSFGAAMALGLIVTPLAQHVGQSNAELPDSPRSTGRLLLRLGALWFVSSLGVSLAGVALSRGLIEAIGKVDDSPPRPRDEVKKTPPDLGKYPRAAWHRGAWARQDEPWPSDGPWTDVAGEGEFSVYAHGFEPNLFTVGRELYVARHPRLFRADKDKLVPMPPVPKHDGVDPERLGFDGMWSDETGRLVLWEDIWRHYGGPSDAAAYYTFVAGAWVASPEQNERVAPNGKPTPIDLVGGRKILFGKEGPTWVDSGASLVLRDDDPGCKPWWVMSFEIAKADDATYIATWPCKQLANVFRVTKDGKTTALPALPRDIEWVNGFHVIHGNRLLLVATCTKSLARSLNGLCPFFFDGKRWVDEGTHLDGMDFAASAVTPNGTAWVLLAHDGNGATGLLRNRGPVPSGELHKRSPDGRWEKMVFPLWPLPDWTCLRFAPIRLGVSGDTAWVSGKWYYVRKNEPDLVETFVYGGLFRHGKSTVPPVSFYPGDP